MAVSRVGKPSVLSFSREPTLVATRSSLLRREGCSTATASTLAELRACLLNGPFDLLIICQSVSSADCVAAARFAREYAPATKVLLMFSSFGKCVIDDAEILLDSNTGPKMFVETAMRILANKAVHQD